MWKVFCVISVGLLHVSCQSAQSPCPEVFEYRNDENGLYGAVRIRHSGPALQVLTQVNYTVAARLPSSYVGSITPINDEKTSTVLDKIFPINLRVNFPIQYPLPRVTSITVNDNLICSGPGDVPGPHQYVTTANLVHTSYIQSAHSAVSRYNYAYQYNGTNSAFAAENYSAYSYYNADNNKVQQKL